jgi:CheY-like chemotaxis protein
MSLPPAGEDRDTAAVPTPSVLVACDEGFLGELLEALLSDAGYRTELFATGVALLERLRSDVEPSVVLLSLRWRPLTSRAVLATVAEDPDLATRHAYIFLTARYGMLPAEEVALLRQLGVPIVPKPFDINRLLEEVARTVARLTGS